MAQEETITFEASVVQATSTRFGKVEVTVDVEIEEYLNPLSAKQIVNNFDSDRLLSEIGVEEVKEYFDLVDA